MRTHSLDNGPGDWVRSRMVTGSQGLCETSRDGMHPENQTRPAPFSHLVGICQREERSKYSV